MQRHNWIHDVLDDLAAYAELNGLQILKQQIDVAHLAMRVEKSKMSAADQVENVEALLARCGPSPVLSGDNFVAVELDEEVAGDAAALPLRWR